MLRMNDILMKRNLREACLILITVSFYILTLNAGRHFPGSDFYNVNLTFNSMLDSLLRWRFDVNPEKIGSEGFLREGKTFAYWGIFCALIRLPMIGFTNWVEIDVTPISCFVAVCVALAFKLRTLYLVKRHMRWTFFDAHLYWPLIIAFSLSGAQILFLAPIIFQEVCLWAGALAAGFVYHAIRIIIGGNSALSSMTMMALFAGLALACRVSTGVGLYAALTGLLLLSILRDRLRSQKCGASHCDLLMLSGAGRRIILQSIVLMFTFIAIVGFINYMRWGDPTVFADMRLHIGTAEWKDRLPRLDAYGNFNLERIPLGIIYYFFPLIFFQRGNGEFFYQEARMRLLDSTDLPPASLFLTDPLLTFLAGIAVLMALQRISQEGVSLWGRKPIAIAIGAGLCVTCLLILSFTYMAHRYRIEFYPLLEFSVFIGLLLMSTKPNAARRNRLLEMVGMRLAFCSVAMSFLTMLLYWLSPLGPPHSLISDGVINYYLSHL